MHKHMQFVLIVSFLFTVLVGLAMAEPNGVTITMLGNETAGPTAAGFVNTSGGTITTINLNGTSQNVRWKAFVGNASGTLTLDDAADNTIYDWSITSVDGEVYVTRISSTINWSGATCAELADLEDENFALNHTNVDDNISATFSASSHAEFFVGTVQIATNTCRSLRTWVNDSAQATNFEEMVLRDTPTIQDGNIFYATILEQDATGFDNNTYDFQLIVPENGLSGFDSATAYYFYMELS